MSCHDDSLWKAGKFKILAENVKDSPVNIIQGSAEGLMILSGTHRNGQKK